MFRSNLPVLMMLWFLAADLAAAGQVAVVVSAKSGPYFEGAEAFRESFQAERPADSLVQPADTPTAASADVVVAFGGESAISVKSLDIPTLHCMTLDAADETAALLLSYPLEDQLQLIQTALPRSTRLGVVYSEDKSAELVEEARPLAKRLGMELVEVRIDGPASLNKTLAGLANRIDVLWGLPDARLFTPQTARTVLVFSFRHRVPFIGMSDQWVKAGAMMAPSFDPQALGRQCVQIAGALLDGTAASEIGAVEPHAMPYSLNRHSLDELKIELPTSIINGAHHVY